jgi:RHS repeat-associated protein
MRWLVIFVILLFVSMPISFAKEISIPELFEVPSQSIYFEATGKEVYYYAGSKLIAVNDKYQYQDRLNSNINSNSLPFGQQITSENRFSFTGKELDKDLYYFNARYYDSNLGKFTSVDPVSDEHPYGYVHNNPMRFVDPSGTQTAVETTFIDQALTGARNAYMVGEGSKLLNNAIKPAPVAGFGAVMGALLAGFFLTSADMQANLQGRSSAMHDPFGLLESPVDIQRNDDSELVEELLREVFAPKVTPLVKNVNPDGSTKYYPETINDDEEYAYFSIVVRRLQNNEAAAEELIGKGIGSEHPFAMTSPTPFIQGSEDPILGDITEFLQYQVGLSGRDAIGLTGQVKTFIRSHSGIGLPELFLRPIVSPFTISSGAFYSNEGHQVVLEVTNVNIMGSSNFLQ